MDDTQKIFDANRNTLADICSERITKVHNVLVTVEGKVLICDVVVDKNSEVVDFQLDPLLTTLQDNLAENPTDTYTLL